MCFSICCGVLAFIFIFFLHIVIWRVFRPKNHISSIFQLFLIFPFILAVFIYLLSNKYHFISIFDFFSACLLFFAISCAYIQTYPAIQAWSPTLKIIYYLQKSKSGLSFKEMENLFSDKALLADRLDDLFKEKLVYQSDNVLKLSLKSKFMAWTFYLYRQLLGLQQGEG